MGFKELIQAIKKFFVGKKKVCADCKSEKIVCTMFKDKKHDAVYWRELCLGCGRRVCSKTIKVTERVFNDHLRENGRTRTVR